MLRATALPRRALVLLAAALFALVSVLPALTQRASAAQLSERSVRITSSQVGATGVTYNVTFKPSQLTNIKGIVIQFCQDSPLIGNANACVTTNGVSAMPADATTVVVNQSAATSAPEQTETYTVDNASDGATGLLILTDADGITPDPDAADRAFTLSFTATNPTGTASTLTDPGTFYGRILTYGSEAGAQAYDDQAPGTHLDDGGVAMSTARQLTVSARVQEQLEFCVAAIPGTVDTNAEAYASCAAMPTTTAIDLGIVESGQPNISGAQATAPQGNDSNGGILIRTNAVGGAVISYYAEQNTSSGQLKVAGATCTPGSSTDQCFNSADGNVAAGSQPLDISATAGENFGMQVRHLIYPTGSTTTNLQVDSNYDSVSANATSFAWVETQPAASSPATTIASSTANTVKVLDYEMLVLRFGARTAATTPTGTYTVTSTYIATAVY